MPAVESSTVRAKTHRTGMTALVDRISATVALWRDRMRNRRDLARMSERELSDIGVSRSQIADEVGKPFWRA